MMSSACVASLQPPLQTTRTGGEQTVRNWTPELGWPPRPRAAVGVVGGRPLEPPGATPLNGMRIAEEPGGVESGAGAPARGRRPVVEIVVQQNPTSPRRRVAAEGFPTSPRRPVAAARPARHVGGGPWGVRV